MPAKFTGPPPVVDWLDVCPHHGSSPIVMDRKYRYVKTHCKRVAKWERRLREAEERGASTRAIDTLQRRLANSRAHLTFSISTLTNVLRFAMARISPNTPDGETLRRERPRRYHTRRPQKILKAIRSYAARLDESIAAYSVAARCPGDDPSTWYLSPEAREALDHLLKLCARSIDLYKGKGGMEADDGAQEAVWGVIRAAKGYDPAHGSYARFATYGASKVRRAAQARRASKARPGYTIRTIEGERKQVARGRIDVTEDEQTQTDRRHPVVRPENQALKLDLAAALDSLCDEDRVLVVRHFQGGESVKRIAADYAVSAATMRRRLKALQARLTEALSAHRLTDD